MLLLWGNFAQGMFFHQFANWKLNSGVNRNTIRRAYLELQNEGTLTIRQGKKAEVATNPHRPRGRASMSQAEMLAPQDGARSRGRGI